MYYLLEYAPNGSLGDLLKREYIVSLKLAKVFIAEILLSLEFLRKMKVVHRDLKPGNILLDQDYHIKLIDFATAKIFNEGLLETMPLKG